MKIVGEDVAPFANPIGFAAETAQVQSVKKCCGYELLCGQLRANQAFLFVRFRREDESR
jgi:hypothetical protein